MKLSMILSQLSTGMAGTISIFVLTLVFSLPLGLLIVFWRMSKNRIVSGIFRLYISLMRGTPLMLQLMVVYFGPFYLFGMNIGKCRFQAIITGFDINYGARPLRRAIQSQVEDLISDEMLSGNLKKGDKCTVRAVDGHLAVEVDKKETANV